MSKALTVHAVVVASLNIAHSLRARGLRRTLLLTALGNAIPVLGEQLAVNVLTVLRHHTRPQVKGVPLAIALGWYNVGYGAFTVMESILNRVVQPEREQSSALAPATALIATSLDLLLDPAGLDLGLWAWSGDGRYATDVEGPNGKRGVPLLNFAGWIGVITSVTLAYRILAPDGANIDSTRLGAGRTAALLLLPYYLPPAAWALKRGRRKYLLYSALFPAALGLALKGR